METKRVSLPSILATRDPSTGKDGLLVNCYTEQGPDERRVVRRPGFVSEALIPGSTCNAQGAYFFAGEPIYMVCDTLIGPDTEPPPPVGTPLVQAQGQYMATDPVTGNIWANMPAVGTMVYDGHTLLHLATISPPINSVNGLPCSVGANVCFEAGSRRVWTGYGGPGNLSNPDVWAIDADTGLIVQELNLSDAAGLSLGTIVNEGSSKLRIYGSGGGGGGKSIVFNVSGVTTGTAMEAPGGVKDSLDVPSGYVLTGFSGNWLRVVKSGVSNDFTSVYPNHYCYNTADGCLYIVEYTGKKLRKLNLTTFVMTEIGTFTFSPISVCYDSGLDLLWVTDTARKVHSVNTTTAAVVRTVNSPISFPSGYWHRLRNIPSITWLVSDLLTVIAGIDVTP